MRKAQGLLPGTVRATAVAPSWGRKESAPGLQPQPPGSVSELPEGESQGGMEVHLRFPRIFHGGRETRSV